MLQLNGYSDIELIYQGTVGESSIVYRAMRDRDCKKVVLKVPSKTASAARKISSLSREYSLLSSHRIGKTPKALELIHTGPSPVLVMEYIEAPPLSDALSTSPMRLLPFFSFAIQLVEIVADMHLQNLIHCDISPGNILYHPDSGLVHLIDFGCALDFPRHARAVLNPTFIEGTPPYMSPEQTGRLNRGLDYRTDFYSLGIIFYRLLTGRMPFVVTDQSELVHCHIAISAQPLNLLSKGIPQVLSDLVLKLLRKDPANRYQSAEGIRTDLVTLSNMNLEKNLHASIELATADMKDRFMIPEKLYGRENECEELIRCYDKAADDEGQMVFISGHAGIGKTSLVKELYGPLAKQGGYLAVGKFDQYQRNQPYSALTDAFSHLIRQILAENEGIVEVWRQAIRDAVGPNGQLLTDVIPGLNLLIGAQSEVDELPVVEARTRFSNVFASFFEMLGSIGRPIVIFLDDLQWIDASSLALLERMTGSITTTKILFIGAYRNNEVPETHRLAISLVAIRSTTERIQEIELGELVPDSLIELLTDTLALKKKNLIGLNNILLQRTHGNPLFFKTTLDGLYADGHIRFDYENRQWTWDEKAVVSTPHADNVIEMLQKRIPLLAGGQADMLGLAACLGNVFELDHLANLATLPRYRVAQDLMPAVLNGLLQPIGDYFELLTEDRGESLSSISFKFAHDRIQ